MIFAQGGGTNDMYRRFFGTFSFFFRPMEYHTKRLEELR